MVRRTFEMVKAVIPWITAIAFLMALFNENYPVATVCLLLLILDYLSDIRDAIKGKK